MPLDLLLQGGLLLVAVVVAFAISAAVGIVIAPLVAGPRPLRGSSIEPRERPPPSTADEAPAGRPYAESLAPVKNPVT